MIQFNLLPDVKLEYIKATRTKHLIMLTSLVLTAISVAIVVVLFIGVNVIQERHLNNLDGDIKDMTAKLQGEPDIDKILTIQNQLNSLNDLHDGKPAAERIGAYLEQVTPKEVSISEIKVDFTANTMTIDGGAKDLKTVNQFVDTLKFTDYEETLPEDQGGGKVTDKAFSSVVMASFSLASSQQASNTQPASYQITLNFNPVIFDITKSVKLVVPNQVTTRSVTERPDLFRSNENQEQEQ